MYIIVVFQLIFSINVFREDWRKRWNISLLVVLFVTKQAKTRNTEIKSILWPPGPLRVRSQNRVHWQYSTILAQTYSFNSDCLASRCDLNLIKDSFGNLWNTGIECKQSLSHKLKKIDQHFVKIPISPVNLLKYCQNQSFWLLTLSGPGGHNIDLTSEFLLGTKIAHVWEEKELLIISNCGILVPVRCS